MRSLHERHGRILKRRHLTLIGSEKNLCERLEPRLMPSADVLTYHNDNMRTGLNSEETTLTLSNVNPTQFGKLASLPVDGAVFAQPLYKSNVTIPGRGVHNVLYVATQHDSLYAFDADTYELLWHDSFIDPAHGVTPVSNLDLNEFDIIPEVGITSTPVIDPATNTIYVVDKIKAVVGTKTFFSQQLIALDIATGELKNGGPVNITATVKGKGAGSLHGHVAFDPKVELQRSALLLNNGMISIAWAIHGYTGSNHGWLMTYDAQTLKQISAFNVTPNGNDGGIWMSGNGPAADAANNIYLVSGSGQFTAHRGGKDYSDAVLKFSTVQGLKLVDYFAPTNVAFLGSHDLDFGSGGALLLPDQPGAHPHLLVAAGKQGKIFLIDRDNLGKFSAKKDRVVQVIPNAVVASFDTPAYFNGTIYYVGTAERKGGAPDVLRAFKLVNGLLNPTPTTGRFTYGYPGSTPSVSANGTSDGIVWTVDNGAFTTNEKPAILRATVANDVSTQLFDSTQNGTADQAGPAVKFTVPTVTNGKVYLGGFGTVTVYGLKTK